MTGKRTWIFAAMVSVAAAASGTPSYANDARSATLILAQATPGNDQRNEGVGVRGGQSGQSGQGASPQGGQGGATQTGTPPAQLKRAEESRQHGKAGASGTGAK